MENSYNNIDFIFAKPYREHYYMYGINSVENLSVIPKDELKIMLFSQMGCTDANKLEYVLERNQSFLYDNKSKEIKKFKNQSQDLTKEDLNKRMIKDIKIQTLNMKTTNSLSDKCKKLFGR